MPNLFYKVPAQAIIPQHCEVLIVPCGHMGYIENKKETLEFVNTFVVKISKRPLQPQKSHKHIVIAQQC